MVSKLPLHLLAASAALTVSLHAQIAHQESMTKWTLTPSAGWTANTKAPGSKGKLVNRLDSVRMLGTTRVISSLKKGWYVATCRVMKFKDEKGAGDLNLQVVSNGRVTEKTIRFTQIGEFDKTTNTYKWVGEWFYMEPVVFEVKTDNAPALFRVYNSDPRLVKLNYYFDWFKIGKIPEGKVFKYQSLDNGYAPWTGAWLNSTRWFRPNTPEAASAFGEVAITNGVNWFDHHSYYGWGKLQPNHEMIIQPGTYTVNWRVSPPQNPSWDLYLRYEINGGCRAPH
ncbi:MAG: hypothetical protein CSA62_15055 [Planctomycetota bacterium]|nr:MAG: hypothetical protein CSA62_15055 [Planctomycetota bacterium]